MEGLYFYKLVSPYSEDVTKDCKLTVNEIDHNFITLKDANIKKCYVNNIDNTFIIELLNGEKLVADMSHFYQDFELKVEYDEAKGEIMLYHHGMVDVIDKLMTFDNASHLIVKYTIADDTICGAGREDSPLGLSPVEKTSCYKAVDRVIDCTKGEKLPAPNNLEKGDRFVTYENVSTHGYLYNFLDVQELNNDLMNGWRVPTKEDWDNMLNAIELCDHDKNHNSVTCNTMLGFMAGKYLKSSFAWVENESTDDESYVEEYEKPKHKPQSTKGVDKYDMSILPSGYGDGGEMMEYFGKRGKYWTSTMCHVTDVFTKRFDYNKNGVVQMSDNPHNLCSLRLVKDYNGHNFHGAESILGVTYNTVLLPSDNTTHGYRIWTDSNVAAYQHKYHPVQPNGGDSVEFRQAYFMYEWNGESWVRKEMTNGDTLVIYHGPDGDQSREYRLVNGQLVNVARDIISIVMNKYDSSIEYLNEHMEIAETNITTLQGQTTSLEAADQQIWTSLTKEIEDRDAVDQQIWQTIALEAQGRSEAEGKLWEAINTETKEREDADENMSTAIQVEIESRIEADTQIWDAINNATQSREEFENNILVKLDEESTIREESDNQILTKLNDEIQRSTEADEYQNGRLINKEDSKYICEEGVLILGTDNSDNTITIQLNGNYGTF